MTEYLRIHVDHIEGDLLYGYTKSSAEVAVVLFSPNEEVDHRYITTLVKQGSQINIVDYTLSEDVYHPRIIIFEPDYLVDVTAIASCCESYGNTHLTHLINRLRPTTHTEAILLGNFASQLLDEEVHGLYNRPYRDSVMEFFRRNTLSLLAANVSNSFHDQARNQQHNIHKAFSHQLTQKHAEAILEPSFISEVYGLQGRMDYLQADYSLLIEQKSGQCGWPQQHPDIPVEQAKHAMQMTLYGAVVEHLNSDKSSPITCLLYSKYSQALLPLKPSDALLHEAIKIRNHIVHAEYTYALEGYNILSTLTADNLNTRSTTSKLWTHYQRPQIEQVLSFIHAADEMERAYYYRMMQFVSREHLYSKIGNGVMGEHGFASKWYDTLEEKIEKGDICHQLHLISPTHGHEGKVEQLVFSLDESTDLQATNFRKGDIVVLYPYAEGSSPDVRKRIIYRCILSETNERTLRLTLRAPQSDAHILLRDANSLWAIEHDFMEAAHGACYRALHAFLSMPRERKDLLLLRREPRIDGTLTLKGEYGEFDSLVLRSKQARDIFLLVGPPGTGKTSHGLMSILREELLSSPDSAILLLAYTNRAVDEICDKLIEAQFDFIRMGNPNTCSEEYHPYLLDTMVAASTSLTEVHQHIKQSRIVVGTAITLNAHSELFALKSFALAIVDEASQILEPYILGILSATHAGRQAVERFILIGDHKQLPAVVKQSAEESHVDEPLLHNALLTNCRESLFERMIKRYGTDPRVTYTLHRQGRMHHDIALFPNTAFYRGMLTEVMPEQCAPLDEERESQGDAIASLFAHRVAFLDTPSPNRTRTDKMNIAEATAIASMAIATYNKYKQSFDPHRTLGIIVPYRIQIAAIRSAIAEYGIPVLNDITIDTVERYQGSQRDVIIYGFTIHQLEQLDFLTEQTLIEEGVTIDRKLNVVMTRARKHLFMTGNAALIASNPLFAQLIDFIDNRNGLFSLTTEQEN